MNCPENLDNKIPTVVEHDAKTRLNSHRQIQINFTEKITDLVTKI